MFSLGASGKLGGAIVYAIWKGRAYCRELVKPANPKSDKQLSVRAAMTFLSTEWAGIGAPSKATWEDLADADVVSTFNAYVAANLKRWRSFRGIGETANYTEALANATAGVATATNGVRMITVTMPITAANFGWGLFIFRKTGSAVTPAFDNLVKILPIDGTNDIVFIDTPLEPATYHYDFYLCSGDGLFELESQPVDADATA